MWDQQELVLQEPRSGEGCQWAADRLYLLPKTVPPLQSRETPEGGVPRQVYIPTQHSNALKHSTVGEKHNQNPFFRFKKLSATTHVVTKYFCVVCACGNPAQYHTALNWAKWRRRCHDSCHGRRRVFFGSGQAENVDSLLWGGVDVIGLEDACSKTSSVFNVLQWSQMFLSWVPV